MSCSSKSEYFPCISNDFNNNGSTAASFTPYSLAFFSSFSAPCGFLISIYSLPSSQRACALSGLLARAFFSSIEADPSLPSSKNTCARDTYSASETSLNIPSQPTNKKASRTPIIRLISLLHLIHAAKYHDDISRPLILKTAGFCYLPRLL